jgi:hypothetical protein
MKQVLFMYFCPLNVLIWHQIPEYQVDKWLIQVVPTEDISDHIYEEKLSLLNVVSFQKFHGITNGPQLQVYLGNIFEFGVIICF